MSELRQDPITHDWVIINPERAERPEDTSAQASVCPFCPGNALSRALGALHRLLNDPNYNLVLVTPPLDQVHRLASHWFIDVIPRLTTPAGFELGSRIVVNIRTPEQAALELRACVTGSG